MENRFHDIQRAWEVRRFYQYCLYLLDIFLNKVLRDEITRKCYDAQLSFSECSTVPIYDSLNLDEMEHDQESGPESPPSCTKHVVLCD